ncbi:hypothetical protein [Sphingobacterium suaedae]|uniref:Uncharacterized protein n=1 Tax=Sphingobacterium suaedae TaxID=1686402 RepID=A0ABW5KKE2_9SPHI
MIIFTTTRNSQSADQQQLAADVLEKVDGTEIYQLQQQALAPAAKKVSELFDSSFPSLATDQLEKSGALKSRDFDIEDSV